LCELAELWHVPPWDLEEADENGHLVLWSQRALLWRKIKHQREERING
jgi:hypothetical protein